ncbi:MAG TPA: competence/damage-inducible protein A [Alphaproteobacteria bacterium]|nr:competence/damage-inducible protein A [Alphaproteobacteria bacterium]
MNKTASLLIIGNEILSGKTQDKNLNYIAKKLANMGIVFSEARVVPDIEKEIIFAVNELRKKFDYVFTTGGIGPTHDDITTECISKAFGLKMICHPEAKKKLEEYYKDRPGTLNEARLRMADTPEGATLIENPLTSAPGYKIENVFVLAGIPSIMQVMFDYASQFLEGGVKISSRSVSCNLIEGDIAAPLTDIQNKYPNTEIGSYPFIHQGKYAVTLVVRTTDISAMNNAADEIVDMIKAKNGIIIEDISE